jgi:hypothetical protein
MTAEETRRGSNAQCEQSNHADSDKQHCECYGIVVQPIHLLLHGTPPCPNPEREGRRDNASGRETAIHFVPEPEREAIQHITYQELYVRVNEVAALLQDFCGLKKGDRVPNLVKRSCRLLESECAPNPNEKPENCYCSALPKGSGLCLPCYTRWLAGRRA